MPTNVTYEFVKAEEEYNNAKTTEDKIAGLRAMITACPSHKGCSNLRSQLKQKLSKLQEIQVKEKQLKRKGKSVSIKKQGSASVCLFSLENKGKSYALNLLTGSKVKSTPKPFETVNPELGMIDYDGVKIQLIEIPSAFSGFHKKYPNYMSIMRTSELIVILGEDKILKEELKMAEVNVPFINSTPERLRDDVWKNLGLIKIYTKQPGSGITKEALGLKKGSKMRNAAEKIHKDFVKKFKYARVWGKKVAFQGQSVGLNYELNDGDVVEVHIKK